jgi:hypothetical protein
MKISTTVKLGLGVAASMAVVASAAVALKPAQVTSTSVTVYRPPT